MRDILARKYKTVREIREAVYRALRHYPADYDLYKAVRKGNGFLDKEVFGDTEEE